MVVMNDSPTRSVREQRPPIAPTALFLLLFLSVTATAADRPHVVMAFADDWGKYAGIYGQLEPGGINDLTRTPHFDAIARDGVLFTNAFVSAPSCTPCRSSLMSGRPFYQCGKGSILSGAIWDFSIPSYPLLLQDNGYRIGHTYKVWSPGKPGDAPHGGKANAFNSAGRRFNNFSQNATKEIERGLSVDQAKSKLLDEVRQNIRSFLDADDDGVLDGDDPVCYFFGPTNTHRRWTVGSGKALWAIDPDGLKGRLPAFLPDTPEIRRDMADYLGEVAAFDASLEVLMQELRRVGIADDTLLVISGDHGVPGVSRGKCNLYPHGTAVPMAVHWPAGIDTPGRVVTDFVSLPDLATTFLQAAGVDPPDDMIAPSILPLLQSDQSGRIEPQRDFAITGRERHVESARQGSLPYPHRAIQTDRYLAIINFAPDRSPMGDGPPRDASPGEFPTAEALEEDTRVAYADYDASPTKSAIVALRNDYPLAFEMAFGNRPQHELYDLQTDPDCMTNLAQSPAFEAVRTDLETRLLDYLRQTNDPRLTDNPTFETGFYTRDERPDW